MPSYSVSGFFHTSFKDAAFQSSNQRLHIPTITAANFTATQTAVDALQAATENMSDGVPISHESGNEAENIAPVYPTGDVFRSKKIAVTFQDTTTGDIYTTQIPIRKNTGLTYLAGTRLLDLTVDPTLAYKTAFTTIVQSEEGHGVVILKMRAVGRDI
jgi:hypothetical protein